MGTSASLNSVLGRQVADGGSLGSIRHVLTQKGQPSLQLINVTQEMHFAIASDLQHQIRNGLQRPELNAVDRKQLQKQLIHAENQVFMRMTQASILRQMGLPADTNLALLDAKQKHLFCNQLQSNLSFLSTILAKPARQSFISGAGTLVSDIENHLLQLSIGGLPYNPPPWLPLTNCLDELCALLGVAKKETKDGQTTYTYPNGTKKVVDANGKATWYDKNGEKIKSFDKDGSFWDLVESVKVFEDAYDAEIKVITSIIGILTGGLTLATGLGLAYALYCLGDKYISNPEVQGFVDLYFGGGMESFQSYESRLYTGYTLHMNNNGAWQLFDPQKVAVDKGVCGPFDSWAKRMLVLQLTMNTTREIEWVRKDGSKMVIDAALQITSYSASGKPIPIKK